MHYDNKLNFEHEYHHTVFKMKASKRNRMPTSFSLFCLIYKIRNL